MNAVARTEAAVSLTERSHRRFDAGDFAPPIATRDFDDALAVFGLIKPFVLGRGADQKKS